MNNYILLLLSAILTINCAETEQATSPSKKELNGAKGTGQQPASGGPQQQSVPTTVAAALTTACAQLTKITLDASLTQELQVLCMNGQPTTSVNTLAQNAYTGQGTADKSFLQIFPIRPLPQNTRQTELMTAGAIKFALPLTAIMAKKEAGLGMSIENQAEKTFITNQILQKYPAKDATYLECYDIKQVIKSEVIGIPMEDVIMMKDCNFKLSENPAIALSYKTLVVGDENNKDNVVNVQINLLTQISPTETYGFSVIHMSVDNKGFHSMAAKKIEKQPQIFLENYYKIITAGQ